MTYSPFKWLEHANWPNGARKPRTIRLRPCRRLRTSSRQHGERRDGALPVEHAPPGRSEEHTSELQSRPHLVCRLLLEKKKSNPRACLLRATETGCRCP